MKRIVLVLMAVLLVTACSDDSNPTDPGSDVRPEAPPGVPFSLNGRYVSEDGTIVLQEQRAWVNGEEKENFNSTWKEGSQYKDWIAIKNPYNEGGWMTLEGWSIPNGLMLDKTYAGKTERIYLYK